MLNSDTTIGLRVLQFRSKCLRIDIHVNRQLLIQRVRAVQMDIGVGSFVVANALVSRHARSLPPSYVYLLSSKTFCFMLSLSLVVFTIEVLYNCGVCTQIRHANCRKYGGVLRNVSPLLILGLARLIVTKGVDYQVKLMLLWSFVSLPGQGFWGLK